MTLLGLSNEKTLYNWKSQPEKAKLTRDLLERASYILGIYKSLQILLPDQVLADQWEGPEGITWGGVMGVRRLACKIGGLVLDLG